MTKELAVIWLVLMGGCSVALPSASADSKSKHLVKQRDKAFAVETLEARVGDTLALENAEDAVAHHVFATEGGYVFNEAQKPGIVTEVKLDHEGDFTVRCAIHPNMKLKVSVKP